MSSINNATNFIFGNRSSEEFGVFLVSGIGSISRLTSTESRDVIISTNGNGTRYGFHGIQYKSPITFDIIIVKSDETYIDTYEERKLKKWLMCNEFKWLQVEQDDMSAILYYVIGVSCEIIDVGSYTGGMKVTFQSDSNSAWSNQKIKQYTTINGALNFKLNIDTDYDNELILPIATITAISNGNISIQNTTRNETVTISDCINGEIIILDSSTGKISTTSNTLLLDRWNKRYIKIQDGVNNITLTGNFNLKLQYRQQVRVGG
jgi:phage-related protein